MQERSRKRSSSFGGLLLVAFLPSAAFHPFVGDVSARARLKPKLGSFDFINPPGTTTFSDLPI
jgi:hypothetical protein